MLFNSRFAEFSRKRDFNILSQELLAKQQAAQHMVQQRQAIMMGKATWGLIMWSCGDGNHDDADANSNDGNYGRQAARVKGGDMKNKE